MLYLIESFHGTLKSTELSARLPVRLVRCGEPVAPYPDLHGVSSSRLFVIPGIVYGSTAFFPALLGRQLDRLGLLQNRAIRTIDGHPPYATVHPLLVQHGLYWIGELSNRKLVVFVWRCPQGKPSATLSALFVRSAGRRTHHERSSGLLSQSSSTRSGVFRPSVADLHSGTCCRMMFRTIARQNTFSISCLPYCC